LLLDKWMKDAVACCQLAGVEPPPSAVQHAQDAPVPNENEADAANANDAKLPEIETAIDQEVQVC